LGDELCLEFEEDTFIERLLKLRQLDRVGYATYPQAVRDVVEEYARAKEAAQKDKSEQKP
jgi:hypothetical protein